MKKHHKLLIGLTVVGVVVLLYLLYKRGRGAGGGSGSVDTSSLPTIISTGGGGINFPMTQSGGAPLSFDATIPGQNPAGVGIQTYGSPQLDQPSSYQVMPGTSASGVPQYTPQAQEFSTTQPIPTPSAATAQPSFYKSAADLPYQQINQDLVKATTGPGAATGASNPTLEAFLQQDVRSYEVNPSGVPADISSILSGEAGGYCGLHPEACAGVDQNALVSQLQGNYSSFLQSKSTIPTGAPAAGNLPSGGTYVNPSGIEPTGTPIMTKDPVTGQAVWTTTNQQPAPASVSTPSAPPSGFSSWEQFVGSLRANVTFQ